MSYYISAALGLSIVFAATIGLVRYGKIYRAYQPFIIMTVMSLLTELISICITVWFHTNVIIFNTFLIVECVLWFWQFRRWNGLFKKAWKSRALLAGMIVFWATETIIGKDRQFDANFAIFYSFCLVFLAINQVNNLILEEKTRLLTNAKFLICAGIIIFYTYNILINSFYIFRIKQNAFMINVYYILTFVNLFVNLLYALATLWIPTRQRFTLPS